MIIKNITTPKQLVDELNSVSSSFEYFSVLQKIDIPFDAFEKYFTWSDDNYTKNCIAHNENYELLLVCWEEGQKSLIQDYGNAVAWIHPLQGELLEERYLLSNDGSGLINVSSIKLGTEEFSYVENVGIHRYSNIYESRTVSLHLYTKPIKQRKIYDCTDGYCKTWTEDMSHDSACVVKD